MDFGVSSTNFEASTPSPGPLELGSRATRRLMPTPGITLARPKPHSHGQAQGWSQQQYRQHQPTKYPKENS